MHAPCLKGPPNCASLFGGIRFPGALARPFTRADAPRSTTRVQSRRRRCGAHVGAAGGLAASQAGCAPNPPYMEAPMKRLLAYSATLGLLAGHATAQVASISFIPALPGGNQFSVAFAATPDGTYVVGYAGASQGPEAYRWNRTTGQMTALGYLATADWFRSRALAVSDDGNTVVGRSDTSDHAHPIPRAFKWTPAG